MRYSWITSKWKFGATTILAVASLFAFSTNAAATPTGVVITFDNLSGPNYGPLTSYTENGFTVYNESGTGPSPGYPTSSPVYQVLAFFGPSIGSNETGVVDIYSAGPVSPTSFGIPFTLDSFDFGVSDEFTATSYTFTGLFRGQTVFTFSHTYGFATEANNTWNLITNPDSSDPIDELLITLDGGDGGANLTQIALNGGTSEFPPPERDRLPSANTPEPSSLALLGTGVLGLAGAVRRRLGAGAAG